MLKLEKYTATIIGVDVAEAFPSEYEDRKEIDCPFEAGSVNEAVIMALRWSKSKILDYNFKSASLTVYKERIGVVFHSDNIIALNLNKP